MYFKDNVGDPEKWRVLMSIDDVTVSGYEIKGVGCVVHIFDGTTGSSVFVPRSKIVRGTNGGFEIEKS